MQFGAATPRRQIDINVIPREFRRRQFPVLTAGLSLVLVGSLLLLYGIFYLKSYSDLEITAFRSRITPAQEAVRAATANEEAANQAAQRYAGQRADYRVLAERQVRWSNVLQAVSSPPAGVKVREISQAGYTVSLLGSAPEFAQAVKFLENLRATDLFSNSSIELVDGTLLAGTATPRVSYGTPTPTRPAGAVVPFLTPSPTMPLTPSATRTPVPTLTPNLAATSTARVVQTATAQAQQTYAANYAKAQQTAAANAARTATAVARTATAAAKPPTSTPTATPITTTVLRPDGATVTEVGGTTSLAGFGPAQGFDGQPSTAWVPSTMPGSAGRWLRIDLRDSVWFTPGTDVIWSVKIVPYRQLLTGTLPADSTGQYWVYTYDAAGTRTKLCLDRTAVNWATTQADTCWSAATHANLPLQNVAVIDVGIPSNFTTDASWLHGIAEVVIEVNKPSSTAAVVGSSVPVGLGEADAPGTATVTPTATRTPPSTLTVSPTRTIYPAFGTPTPTVPGYAIPTPPRPTPSVILVPTPGPIPTPPGQTTAEFLILLEVKPGEGYR